MIFGFGKRTPKQFNGKNNDADNYNTDQQTKDSSSSTGKKKIFGDDEGEYVKFEEIK
jgi:hypothetical protein